MSSDVIGENLQEQHICGQKNRTLSKLDSTNEIETRDETELKRLPFWYEDETPHETDPGRKQEVPTLQNRPFSRLSPRGNQIEMSSSAESSLMKSVVQTAVAHIFMCVFTVRINS